MKATTVLTISFSVVSWQGVAAFTSLNARLPSQAASFELSSRKSDNGGLTKSKTASPLAFMSIIAWLSTASWAFAADFANKDISGQDFSSQDLSRKDFTSVVAKNTSFRNCNLQGSVFAKANLANADFSGADLRGASFVDSTLDGASFKDVSAQNAVFSASILDIGNLENADLTDSLWPSKLRIMICDMDELKGTNPISNVDTRDSLMCTDYSRRS